MKFYLKVLLQINVLSQNITLFLVKNNYFSYFYRILILLQVSNYRVIFSEIRNKI